MSGSPRFSVIVPSFPKDRMPLLRAAVDSVLAQTEPDFECLVIDDCCPTPIPADLSPDPRVRVIRRARNGGGGASCNTGIAAARGWALVFLDDDDLMTPDRLRIAADGLAQAPIAICQREFFTEDGRVTRRAEAWNGDASRASREGPAPNTGQIAVLRDRVVYFDESYRASADVEWWLRLARVGPCVTDDRVGLRFRIHRGVRHKNGRSARVDGLLQILGKHRGYFDANPIAKGYQLRRVAMNAIRAERWGDAALALARSARAHPAPDLLPDAARNLLGTLRDKLRDRG